MKKLITLSCIALTTIVTNAQTTGDYRTKASGNWNDYTNVWQRFNGNNWVNATNYPTSSDGKITILDGNTVTINLSLSLDQVTVDAGGGVNLTYSGYNVQLNDKSGDDFIMNGTMYWSAGTISGAGSFRNNGDLQWIGGTLQCTSTNTGTVSIGTVYITSSVLTNTGTINWFYNSDIRFNGGTLENNGTFNAYGTGTLNNYGGGGTFNNNGSGIFNVLTTGTLTNNISFNNLGKLYITAGTFYNYGGVFTNSKSMIFGGGSFANRATANINNGTKITGNGFFSLTYNTVNFNTVVSFPSGVGIGIYNGSNAGGTGSLSVSSILTWYYGNISIPITLETSGVLNFYNYSGYLYNKLTNNGTINWQGYDFRLNNGSIVNNGSFNLYSDNTLAAYNTTSLTNNATGTITKYSIGTSTIGMAFNNKGTITGKGTFAFGANLTNAGTFDPGIDAATGILATGTNYKNKTLNIRIKGAEPGLDFDRLIVNGDATLNGSKLVVTASGNVPAGSYVIVSCTGKRTGTFLTTTLPANYTVSYKTNQVILTVTEAAKQAEDMSDITLKTIPGNAITISPNPAHDQVNVTFAHALSSTPLQVFDMNGKMLMSKTVNGNNVKLDVTNLSPGTFLIKVNDGQLLQSIKFIKQ